MSDEVPQTSVKGAKYVRLDKDKWKRNIAKRRRTAVLDYIGVGSKVHMPGTTFVVVKKCCSKECFKLFEYNDQRDKFNTFYSHQSKEAQDTFLASCMALNGGQVRKRKTVNPVKERNFTWKYSMKKSGDDISVCREFILNLLRLSEKKIRLIQDKVKDDDSFAEKRGKHGNQKKFQPNVWSLAMDHLKSVPHRQSHYEQGKSNRLYFSNPDLTIKDLHEAFKKFFNEKTGTVMEMKYKTYFKFFRQTNYTFTKPKTDTCDFCKECELKLTVNPNDPCKNKFMVHKKKAEKAAALKTAFIKNAKMNNEELVLEFDYSSIYFYVSQ